MPYKPACGNCGQQSHKTAECPRLTLIGHAVLEQMGVTDEHAREAHRARVRALNAKRVKVLQHKGTLLYSEPMDDHDVQLRASQDMSELLGHYAPKLSVGFEFDAKPMSDGEVLAMLASLGADPKLMLGEGMRDA